MKAKDRIRLETAPRPRGWTALAGLLLSVALLSSVPTQAKALELFGICLTGNCDEQDADIDLIDPKNYDASFDFSTMPEGFDDDGVRAKSELWRGRNKPVGGSAGLVARARGDYRRILSGLYGEGHYGGSISIMVNGREASDIGPGAVLPENSTVAIVVDPGPLYRFGTAEIYNQAPPTDDKKDQVDDFSSVGFASGEPARSGAVRKAASLARAAWRQQGYPKADVADQQITADHDARVLNATVSMEPGPYAVYGDLSVDGTERMDPDFVAGQTRIIPGEEYDPDDLKKARKRLERLGVFSLQRIDEAETVEPGGSIPLNLIVKELPLRRIGGGVTVSSIDGAGIEAFWLHRNLFGKAERLRISGEINGLGTTADYQKLDYSLDATLTKPGFINPDTDLVANVFAKREFNDTYTETSGGGSAVLNYLYSDELTLSGGAFAEYGKYENAFGPRNFLTSGLIAGLTYDNRNDKLEPTRGFYVNLEGRPFYEWEFGNAGLWTEAEGRTYVSVDDEDSVVLAARLKIGSLLGPPIAQTPDDLLFLAGGGRSVRGYEFRSIGVSGPGGLTVGGRSLIEGSLEARVRLTEDFGAVAFVDAGAVSAASFPDFANDPRVGAGAGIRYYTGLGAIRVDVAVPVNPLPGDPDFGVYAGIGQAF